MNVDDIRARLDAIRELCDVGGEADPTQALRYHQPTTGLFWAPDKATKAQLAAAGRDLAAFVADIQQTLGPIAEHAERAAASLEDEGGGAPPPSVTERWQHLLSGVRGLTAPQKWRPGSLGIDLFVPRGTLVRAPFDGVVRFAQVPGGPLPIGELHLTRADGVSVRFRHVQARVTGGGVALEDVVCTVWDPSMDLLRWPGGYPEPPDGYQHLDLGIASHPTRMDPDGGDGGDIAAWDYVWGHHGGVANMAVIARTPGPPEGARFAGLRAAFNAA